MGNPGDIALLSIPVVCPSCEDVLYVARGSTGGHHAGDTLEALCVTCGKVMEILAPAGIEAFAGGADSRVVRFASEFTVARGPRPTL